MPLVRTANSEDHLARLHREHYAGLVRLAWLLLGDRGVSEEVVQDAFVRLHVKWRGLRDVDRAPAYLRAAVLNGARGRLRKRGVVERHAGRQTRLDDAASAEAGALRNAEHDRVLAVVEQLPARQREAVVLRFYLDLREAEMAEAMGISAGSVKTHLHRGLAALAHALGEDDR